MYAFVSNQHNFVYPIVAYNVKVLQISVIF